MNHLQLLYGNHSSIKRMHSLSGSHPTVFQQAQGSFRDFLADYGVDHLLGDPKALEQADYSSASGGVLNKFFGRTIFPQLNAKAPTWGLLPKSKRSRGSPYGWRAKTAFASSGKGGQTEGTVPNPVTSTFIEVAPTIKEHSTQMRITGLQQDLSDIDDAWGAILEVQGDCAEEHAKEIERAVTEDIDTPAGVNATSIDTISASSTNQAAIGWTVGDEDVFGIDRSVQTWANAVQSASATSRALTKALIEDQLRLSLQNGGNPTVIHTGFDTWAAITALYSAHARFDMSVREMAAGQKVNDADVMEGMGVNPLLGSIYGRPITASDQIKADSGELSRLYGLDLSNPDGYDKPRLGIDLVRPTEVFVVGERTTRVPQAIGFNGDSVQLITRFEVGCRKFNAQFQLRDCTSP